MVLRLSRWLVHGSGHVPEEEGYLPEPEAVGYDRLKTYTGVDEVMALEDDLL
jgi:hypothetical protein